MLRANIARMVLVRGEAYLKTPLMNVAIEPQIADLVAEYELAYDIVNDPNVLSYSQEESPLENIIKRFKVQIELWKNVLNLRQGRYYSIGYDENDGITGFLRTLNAYDDILFDSPDTSYNNDEGSILRKLLSVFSLRPTLAQLSDVYPAMGTGLGSPGMLMGVPGNLTGLGNNQLVSNLITTSFMNISIVNVRLPFDLTATNPQVISIENAIKEADIFIIHKKIVPKNKFIIYSDKILFFYANRKSIIPIVTNNTKLQMRFLNVPMTMGDINTINNSMLNIPPIIKLKDNLCLQSVVALTVVPIGENQIPDGCVSLVILNTGPVTENQYIRYNPVGPIRRLLNIGGNTYIQPPFLAITEDAFNAESAQYGTIIMYTLPEPQ